MRRLIFVIGLASLGLLVWWLPNDRAEPGLVDASVQVGQAYAIPVEQDRAAFPLEFSPRSRYLLVVGSLGSASRSHKVLISPSKASLPAACWKRIESLDWSAAKRIPASPRMSSVASNNAKLPSSSPTERQFSIHVTDGSLDDSAQYATVPAVEIARGRGVVLFLDRRQSPRELAPQLVGEIVRLFDEDVLPKFRSSLGNHRDVDGDDRFTVLLTPWLGRLQGGRTSLGGFVRGDDFKRGLKQPFSNSADMMYLNSNLVPGPHLRTLLLHEYTHAVAFSRRTASRAVLRDEEDWLNEAIAHCCEEALGGGFSNLDYRLSEFLNDPGAYPLVVPDYYRAGLWRCHGCRGATYLFLRFCLDCCGPDALERLIDSPLTGRRNLQAATGHAFADLFRAWTLFLANAEGSSALSSIELYGEVPGKGADRWGLAGPHRIRYDVDGEPITLDLRGTAAVYVELEASGSSGDRAVTVTGSPGSMLQLSLVRIDPGTPTIESISAKRVSSGGVDCQVEFGGDTLLQIEQVSLEQHSADRHASICVRGDRIAARPVVAAFSLERGRAQEFSVNAKRLAGTNAPITLKVIARDPRGRRATAWTEVAPAEPGSRPAQVAHRP